MYAPYLYSLKSSYQRCCFSRRTLPRGNIKGSTELEERMTVLSLWSSSCSEKWKWKSLSCVWLYSPWNSLGQRIQPRSSALQVDSLSAEPQGKPKNTGVCGLSLVQWSSWPRNWTGVSCISGGFFANWATREAHRLVGKYRSYYSDDKSNANFNNILELFLYKRRLWHAWNDRDSLEHFFIFPCFPWDKW